MSSFPGFPADTFAYLRDLTANNNRPWFQEHKARYEASFLTPALQLIEALQKPLGRVAPMLQVEAKKSGGSLMRIYKDTRFSPDKTPYKTNIGIQFRHLAGKDVHAPGIYLHVAVDECFFGAGMWRPDSPALLQVREAIVQHEPVWRKLLNRKPFRESFALYDDRLKTAPRGFPVDHPLIDDLRLKSFIAMKPLRQADMQSASLVDDVVQLAKTAAPLMRFLCEALGQPY